MIILRLQGFVRDGRRLLQVVEGVNRFMGLEEKREMGMVKTQIGGGFFKVNVYMAKRGNRVTHSFCPK